MALGLVTYSFLDVRGSYSGPGGTFSVGGSGTGAADEGITIRMKENKGELKIGAGGEAMPVLASTETSAIFKETG